MTAIPIESGMRVKFYATRIAPLIIVIVAVSLPLARPFWARNDVAGKLVVFNDNGAWSWFQDERAIVDPAAGRILVSSVANFSDTDGAGRYGNVEVAALDLASGALSRSILRE